jgi:hypothetical protein
MRQIKKDVLTLQSEVKQLIQEVQPYSWGVQPKLKTKVLLLETQYKDMCAKVSEQDKRIMELEKELIGDSGSAALFYPCIGWKKPNMFEKVASVEKELRLLLSHLQLEVKTESEKTIIVSKKKK